MRTVLRGVALSLGLVWSAASLAGPPLDRADRIRERLADANAWRDHMMVVAHRGGGLAGAKMLYPENSFSPVEAAIGAGAEIVEIDIQLSCDGVYVVFHDTDLDRTTECHGGQAELKRCHLRVEGTGAVTPETMPTLEELLGLTRGRILVNIDNKMAESEIAGIMQLASRLGMSDEIVVNQNLWNEPRIAKAKELMRLAAPARCSSRSSRTTRSATRPFSNRRRNHSPLPPSSSSPGARAAEA